MGKQPLYPHVPKSKKSVPSIGIITQQEVTELVNLYHTAKTAVGFKRYDRLVWAARKFHENHPDISETRAYIEVDNATRA